jgi:hypothetical protein
MKTVQIIDTRTNLPSLLVNFEPKTLHGNLNRRLAYYYLLSIYICTNRGAAKTVIVGAFPNVTTRAPRYRIKAVTPANPICQVNRLDRHWTTHISVLRF